VPGLNRCLRRYAVRACARTYTLVHFIILYASPYSDLSSLPSTFGLPFRILLSLGVLPALDTRAVRLYRSERGYGLSISGIVIFAAFWIYITGLAFWILQPCLGYWFVGDWHRGPSSLYLIYEKSGPMHAPGEKAIFRYPSCCYVYTFTAAASQSGGATFGIRHRRRFHGLHAGLRAPSKSLLLLSLHSEGKETPLCCAPAFTFLPWLT